MQPGYSVNARGGSPEQWIMTGGVALRHCLCSFGIKVALVRGNALLFLGLFPIRPHQQ